LDREQEEADTVGFSQHTTVRLTKDSGIVTANGALAKEVMEAVRDYTGKVTDEDVRAFLRRVVRLCKGIAKRPTGGIYFVPDVNMGVMMSARQALADMDCGARIYVERVMDGKQERENVWGSVEEDVRSQIAETLESVERIEKRASSIVGQQARLEELGELVEVYRGLLGEEAKFEAVAEEIEAAVKTVASKMEKLQQGTGASAKPGAKKAPAVGSSKVVEAAVAVLKEAGKPMSATDLYDVAVAKGLYVSGAKDPYTSFFSVLGKAVGKGEKRIVRVGTKTWTLAA
jgi:hypothetical protein